MLSKKESFKSLPVWEVEFSGQKYYPTKDPYTKFDIAYFLVGNTMTIQVNTDGSIRGLGPEEEGSISKLVSSSESEGEETVTLYKGNDIDSLATLEPLEEPVDVKREDILLLNSSILLTVMNTSVRNIEPVTIGEVASGGSLSSEKTELFEFLLQRPNTPSSRIRVSKSDFRRALRNRDIQKFVEIY